MWRCSAQERGHTSATNTHKQVAAVGDHCQSKGVQVKAATIKSKQVKAKDDTEGNNTTKR
jgi:hypothetical protein